MRLGDILIAQGVLSFNQRSAALRRQGATGKTFGETLLRMGMVDTGQLSVALREQKRMRRLRLARVDPAQRDARR
jgi:hypothetical protein